MSMCNAIIYPIKIHLIRATRKVIWRIVRHQTYDDIIDVSQWKDTFDMIIWMNIWSFAAIQIKYWCNFEDMTRNIALQLSECFAHDVLFTRFVCVDKFLFVSAKIARSKSENASLLLRNSKSVCSIICPIACLTTSTRTKDINSSSTSSIFWSTFFSRRKFRLRR